MPTKAKTTKAKAAKPKAAPKPKHAPKIADKPDEGKIVGWKSGRPVRK